MIKYDFLPVICIIFVKWTLFSPHIVSGKHVVIKIQVPKLVNHQHHTNLVLVHKYKKPTHHHHIIVPHHHDDHHYHHHHHHGHHHHHKTSHGKPNLHHHSHSYGHHHHVSVNHGHPPVHHKPKPKPKPKPDPKHHKSNHYTVGGYFNLASAYKHKLESDKQKLPIKDEDFEAITDVPTNSHDFQVESFKTSPEVHNSYEVHEDHPHDYSSDYHSNEDLKDYAEDYTNPYSVSKFTSNIEHGSINLEENHYNPEHQSEISEYVNEYNESDYDT